MAEENNPDLMTRVLAAKEPQIREVVAKINAALHEDVEARSMSLTESGFALGWSSREEAESHVSVPAVTLHVIRDAIAAMDEAAVQGGDAAMYSVVRNKMAVHLKEVSAARRDSVRTRLQEQFTDRIVGVIMGSRAMSEDETMELAFAAFNVHSSLFAAFVYSHDDASITCRCPAHFLQNLMEKQVRPKEVEAKQAAQFPTTTAALTAFATWYLGCLRETLSNVIENYDNAGSVDLTTVSSVQHDLLGRLTGKQS